MSLPSNLVLYNETVFRNFVQQYMQKGFTEKESLEKDEEATKEHMDSLGD